MHLLYSETVICGVNRSSGRAPSTSLEFVDLLTLSGDYSVVSTTTPKHDFRYGKGLPFHGGLGGPRETVLKIKPKISTLMFSLSLLRSSISNVHIYKKILSLTVTTHQTKGSCVTQSLLLHLIS